MEYSFLARHAEVQYQCKPSSRHLAHIRQGYRCSPDGFSTREWFRPTDRGYLLSITSTFFSEDSYLMLEEDDGKVSMGGRSVTNLHFTDYC